MKWAILGLVVFWIATNATFLGMLVQPWAPFWFSSTAKAGGGQIVPPQQPALSVRDPGDLSGHGYVSDMQRYQLARFVGWDREQAILAVAISIAENGSGNPAALSGENKNHTRDLGLWQINTIWWAQFGGPQALSDPLANARAAFYVFGRQGWCAWSTYEASCGAGHTGAYRAHTPRARLAADTPAPPNQA